MAINWHCHLTAYWDTVLLAFIYDGFPLNFDGKCHLELTKANYTSAFQNPYHIKKLVVEESFLMQCMALFLMVSDKQNLSQERAIVDLSW